MFSFKSTEKQEGFDFNGYQTQAIDVFTFNKFTENKDQHKEAELPVEGTAITTINTNNQSEVNGRLEVFCHNSIRELIQDDQMFRLDCDPNFFDSMNAEENFNNNIGLEQYKDLDIICSDGWIPAPAELEFYSQLPDSIFESDTMEKKEEPTPAPSPSPIPAPMSPAVVEAVEVKSETNPSFDLINFIIFGKVSK